MAENQGKCPVTHSVDPSQVETKLIEEEEPKDVKEVPYQWWKFGLLNFIQLKRKGWCYIEDMIDHFNSRVFSLKLDEWTTFVCDYEGIDSVLDLNKTLRNPGHGFLNFRPDMMNGRVPCLWSNNGENSDEDNGRAVKNGEKHELKKAFIMNYLKEVYELGSSKDLLSVVEKEFKNMKSLDLKTLKEAELANPEDMFLRAAHNVTSCSLLNTYWEDPIIIHDWTQACFRQTGIFGSAGNTAPLADKVLGWFSAVEQINDLKTKFPDSGLDEQEMFNEIRFMICGNASPAVSIYTINSLHCYLRLSESDKQLLKQEADTFFSAAESNQEDASSKALEILRSSPHLHSFFLEVIRTNAIPVVYGRAKKDFILKSSSGNFSIKKGDNLCGMPLMVHRDTELYENATTFDMHRDVEHMEQNHVGYGGYYRVKAGADNHKCGGVRFSMDVVKLMVFMYTRCTFVLAEDTVYTGGNIMRKYSSDRPLALLKFSYNHI